MNNVEITDVAADPQMVCAAKEGVLVLSAANTWSSMRDWGHGRYFLKELEDKIFSYKAVNLPLSSSLCFKLFPHSLKIMQPLQRSQKRRSASRIYENIVPSKRHIRRLSIVIFLCFFILKSIKVEMMFEERKWEFLWLQNKIPVEQLQYCNYNNLHFSDA